jgi:hypothetical protein
MLRQAKKNVSKILREKTYETIFQLIVVEFLIIFLVGDSIRCLQISCLFFVLRKSQGFPAFGVLICGFCALMSHPKKSGRGDILKQKYSDLWTVVDNFFHSAVIFADNYFILQSRSISIS